MNPPLTIDFESIDKLPGLLQQLKFNNQKNPIYIILPTEHTMTHVFIVDANLTDLEIILFLKSHSEKFFGHPLNKLSLDYKTESASDTSKQRITAVAAHVSLIQTIQVYFDKEKIMLHSISIKHETTINLLPWREIQRKQHIQRRNKRFILYGLTMIVMLFFIKYFLINETKEINDTTHSIKQKNKNMIIPNAKNHIALLKKLQSVDSKKLAAVKKNKSSLALLSAIANNISDNITLNSLTLTKKEIKLTGVSNQLSDIHQYNAILQKNLPWKNSQLIEVHNDDQKLSLMHFTIEATS